MAETEQPTSLPHAEYRRFESMREYEALIDEMIPRTLRAIRIFDKSLGRSYNSAARCEMLKSFLRASRLNRLYIVVHEAGEIGRHCPRLVELLRQFSHAATVRETLRNAKHVYDPFVIFDASHYLHRFHYDHLRAAQGLNDVNGTQLLLDRFAELWEASAPSVPADVSGL